MSLDVTVRDIAIPAEELSWRFSRSAGPGGQSVNTTDSRVELSFDVAGSTALPPVYKERAPRVLAGRRGGRRPAGVLAGTAPDPRPQLRTRGAAAERIPPLPPQAPAAPPKPRRPTKPSRAARERRREDKRRTSERKRLRRNQPDE